jgi:hypothetical protein
MARGIIYLITNKDNGHKYVGQTTQAMNKEWQRHIHESNRMSSEPLHRAFREYGVHKFGIKEIDECDESLLNEKEAYWIEYYDTWNGYNIKPIKEEKKKEEIIIVPIKKEIERPKKSWGSLTDKNRGNGKHCGLRIRGKNMTTGVCTDYENAREAARAVTGDPKKNANILLAARHYGRIAYGHRWQILEEKSKKKAVFGVNKKTELIEVRFESIAAAVRAFSDDISSAGIRKSIKHPGRYSWKGYYWFLG